MERSWHSRCSIQTSSIQSMIHLVQFLSLDQCRSMTSNSMDWVCEVLKIDRRKSRGERVYCPYCDMNNHPRFCCKFYGLPQAPSRARQALMHMVPGQDMHLSNALELKSMVELPNQTGQEERRRLQSDHNREPDLRWDKEGNLPQPPLPPPAEAPPQEGQQRAPQDDQQPLCAAAVMMHGRTSNNASI